MGLTDNPYSKNKFGTTNTSLLDPSKPVFGSTPNVATFGNTEVITNKPIVTQNSMALPTGNFKFEKSQAYKDFETQMKLKNSIPKYSMGVVDEPTKMTFADKYFPKWKNRTKTQKVLIIGGSVFAVALSVFFIRRAIKK